MSAKARTGHEVWQSGVRVLHQSLQPLLCVARGVSGPSRWSYPEADRQLREIGLDVREHHNEVLQPDGLSAHTIRQWTGPCEAAGALLGAVGGRGDLVRDQLELGEVEICRIPVYEELDEVAHLLSVYHIEAHVAARGPSGRGEAVGPQALGISRILGPQPLAHDIASGKQLQEA